MFIPITRQDFIIAGRWFPTDGILQELSRLIPVATEDIAHLASRGYSLRMLQELKLLRGQLQGEDDGHRKRRNDNKKPLGEEATAIRTAILALRTGAAMATCAIAHRRMSPNETPESTREAVAALMDRVETLGTSWADSARLRVRLTTLRSVLTLPELEPSASEAISRAEFVERIDALARRLPSLADMRIRVLEHPEPDFDGLDEADGRAYFNMKLMTRVGRAVFQEIGQSERAASYHLSSLDRPAPLTRIH